MYVFAMLLSVVFGGNTIAQVPPSVAPLNTVAPLNNGPCMDSPRSVPLALQPPAVASMQIVRIDKVVATSSMLENEVIGFLYTLEDGSTWLGQRSQTYMSAADASAINQVLASTHAPGDPVHRFPPQMKHGIATKYQQFFKVQIPAAALTPLNIRLDPCVAWPTGRPLPTPSM